MSLNHRGADIYDAGLASVSFYRVLQRVEWRPLNSGNKLFRLSFSGNHSSANNFMLAQQFLNVMGLGTFGSRNV